MNYQRKYRNIQRIYCDVLAFAAVLGNGHVVTWGRAGYGGDSAAVQEQLRDVQHISSTLGAFAGVLGFPGGGPRARMAPPPGV